ncbi:pectin acetylesterase-family hydrolase [Piscinibacter sp.]|uniref:pectin acetylesterase-family hydrolase n=1 Tax=Piscinibacter sp. TaxID=1903157 RepID=UPI002B986E45|nr:pectin acetylesterase-family hydrolase [Albitalea sp.]HUG22619.1 pectin acetylesterase-family hydrolase [Albitalea sp.]
MERIRAAWRHGSMALVVGLAAVHAGAKPPAPPPAEWIKVENPGPVVGADGKLHQATCSGLPGTDPTFSFWTKRGKSKNLAVYFEGGGACWDNLTCTFPIADVPGNVPQFFVPAIPPTTDPSTFDGIFRTDHSSNPVKDWNFVYIPYCTGDIHTGSVTRQYNNVGHPTLPLPASFPIEHRGFDNFMVVLDWIKSNIDAPKRILVAGSSAGGYGATANFPWLASTYPHAHMYVIADASQGVTTPAFDTGTPGRGSWDMNLAPWVFGEDPSLIPGPDLLRVAASAHPNAKIAQFTTAFDGVQIGFYGVMKQYYGPGGSCPNVGVDWSQQMLGTLQSYAAEVPNYRHYLAAGNYHTNLRSPLFYTEDSAGMTYSNWVAAMLRNRGGTEGFGGGLWRNLACEDCLVPPPCP